MTTVLGAHCCSYSGVGVCVGKSSGSSCLRLCKGLVSLGFLQGCWFPGSAVGQGVGPPSLCGVSSFLPGW